MKTKDIEKQTKLNILIELMSQNVSEPQDILAFIRTLQEIYTDQEKFRHSYSSISGKIIDLNSTGDAAISNITQNLRSVIDEIESDPSTTYSEEFIVCINKLFDHISLEETRLNMLYEAYDKKVIQAEETSKESKKQYDIARDLSKNVTADLDKIKTEMITVLSIFAAIVLAFMGGISFSSSTLEGMANSSMYKVVFIATICGMVVFNTVIILMYLISKITGKSIYANCESENCTCNNGAPKCNSFNRVRKRLPYIYVMNTMMLGILALDILAWMINIKELALLVQSYIFH